MTNYFALIAVLLFAACAIHADEECEPSITRASGFLAPKEFCAGDLIFEDTFDDELDCERWQHENTLSGGGNWEFQWYANNRSNSFVEDGNLHIRPTLVSDEYGEAFLSSGVLNVHGGAPADACTNPSFYGCERAGNPVNIINPIKSARLRTVESFAFRYGKLEVRARLPVGDWIWPALWLMPKSNMYGTWPSSGEIDLMESRGNTNLRFPNGEEIGVTQIGQTLHFGPRYDLNGYPMTNFVINNPDGKGYNEDFHLYQMEWNEEMIILSVDGQVTGSINSTADGGYWARGLFDEREPGRENPWKRSGMNAPFDQQFYLIMNVAIGGTNGYFPDQAINGNGLKPWSNTSPQAFADFWRGRNLWLPTWDLVGDKSSMLVDYVRIWAL